MVILDFWASWCTPCRVGLPIVTEVAQEFKDKGVVLYAVNTGEDEALAQAFVDSTGLNAVVAMDVRGEATEKYRATQIPRTIIIDKEGVIRAVHAGVGPGLRSDLRESLTSLTE